MRSPETNTGIHGVDVTTAMHLFNPQDTFAMVNELNRQRPQDQWANIELYPTIGRLALEPIRVGTKVLGLELPMTPNVSLDQVRKWQQEYPRARVSRIHMPFSYNTKELLHRPLFGESTVKERAYQIAWVLYFGAATNERGVKMAEELAKDQPMQISGHSNVIEGFAQDGRLDELKQRVPVVLTENERRYNSPIVDKNHQNRIFDPIAMSREIADRYGLDGIVLGVDHGDQQGIDMQQVLKDDSVRRNTVAMHFAKTAEGQDRHDVIAIGDEGWTRFLSEAASTPLAHSVRGALDYGPAALKGLSGREELALIRRTINWIMSTQK